MTDQSNLVAVYCKDCEHRRVEESCTPQCRAHYNVDLVTGTVTFHYCHHVRYDIYQHPERIECPEFEPFDKEGDKPTDEKE